MFEYTHELRWKKPGGELGKAEDYYNQYNKHFYAEDEELLYETWEHLESFIEKQHPTKGWQVIEIKVDLENK